MALSDIKPSHPNPDRNLPDLAICRSQQISNTHLFDCLVKVPFGCKHALSFGDGYFCRHPESAQFATRTMTEQRGVNAERKELI